MARISLKAGLEDTYSVLFLSQFFELSTEILYADGYSYDSKCEINIGRISVF